jgi:hypothetical protein
MGETPEEKYRQIKKSQHQTRTENISLGKKPKIHKKTTFRQN